MTVMLALAGCAPASVVGPTPTASPSPTATIDETPIVAPTPHFDGNCTDIGGALSGDPAMSSLTAIDPLVTQLGSAATIPASAAIEQVGGISCEWSNGEYMSSTIGLNVDYRGIRVDVVIADTANWALMSEIYGLDSTDRMITCISDLCTADVRTAAGYWVAVYRQNTDHPVPLADFTAVIDALEAEIDAFARVGSDWQAPIDTIALPGDCESVVTADQVGDAFASTDDLVAQIAGGGWSMFAGVMEHLDAMWCSFVFTESDTGPGAVYWLPGGEWAWERAAGYSRPWGDGIRLTLDDLRDGESAWLRCAESACSVDLIVGHHWIVFSSYREPGMTAPAAETEAVAEAIASNLNALR